MLYYISHNSFKRGEVVAILRQHGIAAEGNPTEIKEMQSTSIEEIARDKAKKAFTIIKRPLLVEQTGLILEEYNGFPGGMTQPVWDAFGSENFSKLFGGKAAKAVSVFAYCDGKKVTLFSGETEGRISTAPQGESSFQWDTVFLPEKSPVSFAEMTLEEKNEVSMRRRALDQFIKAMEARP